MGGYGFQLDLKYGILKKGKKKIAMHRHEDASVG